MLMSTEETQIKICLVCKTAFKKPIVTSQKRWDGVRRYCSRKCKNIAQSQNNRDGGTDAQQQYWVSLKGQVPWNKGKKTPLTVRKKLSESHKGEKSHRWKGGITQLAMCIRNLWEYKAWRLDVYKKEDCICRACGHKGHDNHAHHLIPFSVLVGEFLQKYNQFSPIEDKDTLVRIAITYEPFWDIENGIVLCKECHANVN